MRLQVDLVSGTCRIRNRVLVCILKDAKGRITYNSGLIYFRYAKAELKFRALIEKGNPGIEIISVDVYDAHRPEEGVEGKGYWCPYCQTWNYWLSDSSGNKRCPICTMSSNEYSVKIMNGLWSQGMKSKTSKKRLDRIGGI